MNTQRTLPQAGWALSLVLVLALSAALAQGEPIVTAMVMPTEVHTGESAELAQDEPIVTAPGEMDWQAGPGSLPEGSEFVVLEGAPSEEGPLTLRLRFPAGYEIPPHTHPALEHVTVLSGRLGIGHGDSFDPSAGTILDPGGFFVMPIGHAHFVWAEEDTVVQLHSIGPWGIDYLDPEDDPRE